MENNIIQRTSVNEQIVRYMEDAVRNGRWQVGEKIPSEAELAEFFGVSKLTVRVALQQLIGMEVLEKRVGDGTYVKAFDFGRYIQKGFDFYMHPELLEQVKDFRMSLELPCCRLAIQNGTKEEREELKRRSTAFSALVHAIPPSDEVTEEQLDEIAEADFQFHRQVCRMAHNELLLNAFDMAKLPITQYVEAACRRRFQTRVAAGQPVSAVRDIHGDILKAILDKDYKACERYYVEMIDRDIEL